MRSSLTLSAVIAAFAAATATASATPLHSRLSQLQQAFKHELITKDEYAKAKAEVLAAFTTASSSKLNLLPATEIEANGDSPFTNLVFSDDFSGPLDLDKWDHEITMGGGGNWEFECELGSDTSCQRRVL